METTFKSVSTFVFNQQVKEKHVVATQNQQVRNEESKNEKWLTTVDMKILSVMGKRVEKEQTSGALPNSHYICVTTKTD